MLIFGTSHNDECIRLRVEVRFSLGKHVNQQTQSYHSSGLMSLMIDVYLKQNLWKGRNYVISVLCHQCLIIVHCLLNVYVKDRGFSLFLKENANQFDTEDFISNIMHTSPHSNTDRVVLQICYADIAPKILLMPTIDFIKGNCQFT